MSIITFYSAESSSQANFLLGYRFPGFWGKVTFHLGRAEPSDSLSLFWVHLHGLLQFSQCSQCPNGLSIFNQSEKLEAVSPSSGQKPSFWVQRRCLAKRSSSQGLMLGCTWGFAFSIDLLVFFLLYERSGVVVGFLQLLLPEEISPLRFRADLDVVPTTILSRIEYEFVLLENLAILDLSKLSNYWHLLYLLMCRAEICLVWLKWGVGF